MGAKQTCELDKLSDVCQMSSCVKKVEGVAANSLSPTDTWVCTLEENTTFQGKPYSKMFLKVGLSPNTLEKTLKRRSLGLIYELRVYDGVITPLIDNGICPHFVRSLLVSENCTERDLLKTLKKGLSWTVFSEQQITRQFRRNFGYIVNLEKKRPAIQTEVSLGEKIADVRSSRFVLLATEYDRVAKYGAWLQNQQQPEDARICVMLQILIALYAMQCCKLCHNDLHHGNVFIQRLEASARMQYIIEGKHIAFDTWYKLTVYDFDRASCVSLGENVCIAATDQSVADAAFEVNRDVARFAKILHRDNLLGVSCLGLVVDATKFEDTVWAKGVGSEVPTPIIDMIQTLSNRVPTMWQDDEKTYEINSWMFRPNGSLSLHKQKKASKHLLDEYAAHVLDCQLREAKLREEIREEVQKQNLLLGSKNKMCDRLTRGSDAKRKMRAHCGDRSASPEQVG